MILLFNGGSAIGSLMLSINGLIVFDLTCSGCQHWSCWIQKVMEVQSRYAMEYDTTKFWAQNMNFYYIKLWSGIYERMWAKSK